MQIQSTQEASGNTPEESSLASVGKSQENEERSAPQSPSSQNGAISSDSISRASFKIVMVDVSLRDNAASHNNDEGSWMERWVSCNKLAINLILVAMLIYAIWDSYRSQNILYIYQVFLQWVDQNPLPGIFSFILAYFLATILFLPVGFLTMGAGFVFASNFGFVIGVLIASCLVFVSATLASYASFFLGRYLARDTFIDMTMDNDFFKALDLTAQDHGWYLLLLLRFANVIPLNPVSYAAGISGIPFIAFFLANFAILPGIVFFVALGAYAPRVSDVGKNSGVYDENGIINLIDMSVSGALFLIFLIMTSIHVMKEMRKAKSRRLSRLPSKRSSLHSLDCSGFDRFGDNMSLCSMATESEDPKFNKTYDSYL